MRTKKLPTLVGLFILTAGLTVGVLLVKNSQIFRLGAEPTSSPKDVRISNTSDNSFTVTWITEEETSGFVKWGENQNPGNVTVDQVGETGFIHSSTVEGLAPETTYYFGINSEGYDFDNNGILWQTKTAPSPETLPTASLITGSIVTATGSPAEGLLVYAQLAGANLLSSVTSNTGSWVITLSNALSQDLSSRATFDASSTIIEIAVQGGPAGVATAKIYPQDANPAPPIILGQVHDFRNLTSPTSEELPESSVILPGNLIPTPTSGFNLEEEEGKTPSEIDKVTIESIDEGEIITSINPEFFGEGPPGTTITIKVESTPVNDQLTVSSFGAWNWSPPTTLSEGVHKITITWKDKNGIVQSITKNFVVQAAEGPAFESTPSGSTATPTPTATPSPTSTPTPTPTTAVSPTQTPTPTATSTPTPILTPTPQLTPTPTPDLPESGSLTPTIAGAIMGLGFLIFSAVSSSIVFLKEKRKTM